jgi:hypothetical protein
MKGFLLVLLGLIVGGVVGVIGGGMIGTGVGAGVGIVTGLQAGACLTVEAAKEKGLITAEHVPEIFAAAGDMMRAEANVGGDTDFADTDAECQEVVAKLKQSAADTQLFTAAARAPS